MILIYIWDMVLGMCIFIVFCFVLSRFYGAYAEVFLKCIGNGVVFFLGTVVNISRIV